MYKSNTEPHSINITRQTKIYYICDKISKTVKKLLYLI